MLSDTHILSNLQKINTVYQNSSNDLDLPALFSKLAILEVCGWIEEAMDNIVLECANRLTLNIDDLDTFEKESVKKTYSFSYDKHFRRLLVQLIGLRSIAAVEQKLDQAIFAKFKSDIYSLKVRRDDFAHAHVQQITHNFDAPSVTIPRFRRVYSGLSDIENTLIGLGH